MIYHPKWIYYRNIARLTMVNNQKGVLYFYYFQGSMYKLINRKRVLGGKGKYIKKQIRNNENNSYLWTRQQALNWCSQSNIDGSLPVILQTDYSNVVK